MKKKLEVYKREKANLLASYDTWCARCGRAGRRASRPPSSGGRSNGPLRWHVRGLVDVSRVSRHRLQQTHSALPLPRSLD